MIIQVYYSLYSRYYMYTCIDKSMQIVLERGSLDKPLNFNIGLLQPIFHTSMFTYACKGVFNPNIPIFLPNSAEGLHFSAFHFKGFKFIFFCRANQHIPYFIE